MTTLISVDYHNTDTLFRFRHYCFLLTNIMFDLSHLFLPHIYPTVLDIETNDRIRARFSLESSFFCLGAGKKNGLVLERGEVGIKKVFPFQTLVLCQIDTSHIEFYVGITSRFRNTKMDLKDQIDINCTY